MNQEVQKRAQLPIASVVATDYVPPVVLLDVVVAQVLAIPLAKESVRVLVLVLANLDVHNRAATIAMEVALSHAKVFAEIIAQVCAVKLALLAAQVDVVADVPVMAAREVAKVIV